MKKPTARRRGADSGGYATEMWPIDQVKPYPANAKKHTEEAVARLAAVLREVGFQVPIVVDPKGVILKGHRTRLAAIRNGAAQVPVKVAHGLSAADA